MQAKPCRYLWVGGIGSSVTKEHLKEEFLKFGKIEDYTFLRDRNSAVIVFVKMDDAVAAKKNLDRKRISEEQIRVDFLRPQPSKVVCILNISIHNLRLDLLYTRVMRIILV